MVSSFKPRSLSIVGDSVSDFMLPTSRDSMFIQSALNSKPFASHTYSFRREVRREASWKLKKSGVEISLKGPRLIALGNRLIWHLVGRKSEKMLGHLMIYGILFKALHPERSSCSRLSISPRLSGKDSNAEHSCKLKAFRLASLPRFSGNYFSLSHLLRSRLLNLSSLQRVGFRTSKAFALRSRTESCLS